MSIALAPIVSFTAVAIIYSAQVLQETGADTEVIDLVDYEVKVTEPEDCIVPATATATASSDFLLARVAPRSSSCPIKAAPKIYCLNRSQRYSQIGPPRQKSKARKVLLQERIGFASGVTFLVISIRRPTITVSLLEILF